jgi:sugar phosphate permease
MNSRINLAGSIAASRHIRYLRTMLTSAQQHQLSRLGWTAFALVALAYILAFFHRFAPATIAADLQADFAIGPAQLGNLAATYFYVYTLMQVPTGVLADTLGPRRIVALGGLIAGLGSLLFGLEIGRAHV